MSEKTHEPTDKKIEDARKKGQVPVSRDLAKLGLLAAVGELAFLTEPLWRGAVDSLMILSTQRIGQPFIPSMMEMLSSAGILLLIVFGACFLVCVPIAILGHWGQFGILIAPEAVMPKADKLNPVNGFKQMFAKKKLIELLITCFKAALITWILFIVVRGELPTIVQLAGGEPSDIYQGFITLLRSIFHTILGVCAVLALVDFAVNKHFHIKDLMMDFEEIKREYKESEGDPMVKGMRKQIALQLAMSEPVAKTGDANAVVVNPTHFAVAMLYDGVKAQVPIVLARGKDEIAQAMIKRAKECGIPVIRHVWLARSLYATGQEDTPVPKSTYESVALVYAVVSELQALGELDRVVELEMNGDPPESHTN